MITDRKILENALLGIEMRQLDLIQERAHLNQMLEALAGPRVGRPKKEPAKKPKRVITPEGRQRMKEAVARGHAARLEKKAILQAEMASVEAPPKVEV